MYPPTSCIFLSCAVMLSRTPLSLTCKYEDTINFHMSSADIFKKKKKKKIRKTLSGIPSVSNSLDPNQARHIVGPYLDSNCLPEGYQQITLVDKDFFLPILGNIACDLL